MKKNATIFIVLGLLAIVPVTLTFLCSGENEDAVRVDESQAEEESAPEPSAEEPQDSQTSAAPRAKAIPLSAARTAKGVPVFKGFEDPRYQQYDAQIRQFCEEFNKNRSKYAGSTAGQASGIGDLTPAQVKAHMIQETGGGDLKSRTAWKHDPLQVNVPGDWNPYKKYLGLKQPRRCNEGSGAKNLRAGLMLLVRKGFGVSGQPAANRPDGAFDGWPRALQRYNGRSDKAATGVPYSEAYSARIRERASNPGVNVEIPIPTAKKKR